jgi:hypothetical protein
MVKDPLKELNVRHIHTKGQRATSSFGKSAKVSIEIHRRFQCVAQSVDFGNINIVILPFNLLTHSTAHKFSFIWNHVIASIYETLCMNLKRRAVDVGGVLSKSFSVIRYLQILIKPKRGVLGLKSIRMTSNPILHPF